MDGVLGHARRDVLPAIDNAEFITGVKPSATYEVGPFRPHPLHFLECRYNESDMDTPELLRDIAGTVIGLAPSAIHGIGVFALADIPAGRSDLFSPMTAPWPAVPLSALNDFPAHVRKLIDTYCLQDDDTAYLPPHGFRIVDLVTFLNHADEPNLRQMEGGSYFVTLRDIAAGEELTIDYGILSIE